VHVRVCVYVCVFMHVCVCVMHVCVYVCVMHVCVYVYVFMHVLLVKWKMSFKKSNFSL